METGIIMSMETSHDAIGSRTRDLPAFSAVPQPTAAPRAPFNKLTTLKGLSYVRFLNLFVCGFFG